MIPERVELMISMTAKRKKQFETPVGRFLYLYCPQTVFNMGIQLEDAGDQKHFFIASPEKALCDMTAMQTHISTKKAMKEFLELMRLDFSAGKKPASPGRTAKTENNEPHFNYGGFDTITVSKKGN